MVLGRRTSIAPAGLFRCSEVRRLLRPRGAWWIALLAVLLSACRSPIGTERASVRQTYRQIHANAVSASRPSRETQIVLRRFDQESVFAEEPAAALRSLHRKAEEHTERSLLFALAELSYLAGERALRHPPPPRSLEARDYHLAAAVYAYLFLLGEAAEPVPDAFDPRFRIASDLYSCGLGRALAGWDDDPARVAVGGGRRRLPVGQIDLEVIEPPPPWDRTHWHRLLLADQFTVRGFSVRNRQPGLGTPLVAVGRPAGEKALFQTTPLTVFLRVRGTLRDLGRGLVRGSLEVHSPYETTGVTVGDRTVPLEIDTTVHLAYALNQEFIWRVGRLQFLSPRERIPSGVHLGEPYRPGRIPVVFVHGTFSSPVKWAEMVNTLGADFLLRQRYQFWTCIYNTGNPVSYSAVRLREALVDKVRELDPEGRDPALRQMIVIGHSQGGLLTKLTATDTGDRLWRAFSTNRLEDLGLDEPRQAEIRRYVFFTALPFVQRVVFISTPHRGSYRANNLARKLARWLVRLPNSVLDLRREQAPLESQADIPRKLRAYSPTSIDSMSPRNPWMLALADIPLAPSVKGHSIVAMRGNGDPHRGKDGLVAYSSAHVDYVESELVVRGRHSCLDLPATIEEVRRILYEHLESVPDPDGQIPR